MNDNNNFDNGGINPLPGGTISVPQPALDGRQPQSQPSLGGMQPGEQAALGAAQQPQAAYQAPQPQPAPTYAPPTGSPVSSEPVASRSSGAQAANPIPSASAAAPSAHGAAAKGSSGGKTFLVAFAGALVACVLAFGVAFGFGLMKPAGSSPTIGATQATSIEASQEEVSLAEAVADKCLPSVVSIDVYATTSSSGNSIYDYFYGGNSSSGELTETGLGSGVVLSDDGYIVTNNHVISSGEKFNVTIEGEIYEAELIGAEPSADIAVLKVKDGKDFKAIEIGDSDNIKVGEWVMSLGSPFGLEQSVATGIVSATSRSQVMGSQSNPYSGQSGDVTLYPNLIQTDAAINPGNSGGALVDANGRLIGINTLITSYSGNYSGVGFAIPSNYAISLAQSLIAGEEPTHAYLGITMTTIDKTTAQRYGFKVDSGAYISSVAPGTPAEKAGLQVGDIIVKFDGKAVTSSSDLMLDVRTKQPGDEVKLTVNRNGENQEVAVTLGKSESSNSQQSQQQQQQNSRNQNGNGYGNGSGSGSIEDLLRQFGR